MNIPLIDLKGQYKKIERGLLPKLKELLAAQRLILGPYCTKLEGLIADYSGVPHAVSCASGTDALILALMALGIGKGDEVVTTPYTFFSTASSVALVGAKPVFVDIRPDDMNIDPKKIEAAITPRTKAITVVHLFGRLADMDAVSRIAGKHHLAVIEDMAQSIGSRRNGTVSGGFGDIAALSFYPTKNLGGIGEGGMVLTNRRDLYERVRMLRVHGMNDVQYHHELIGLNARLDEIKACALVEKFQYLESWNRKRIANARFYNKALSGLPVALPPIEKDPSHIFHQYVVRVEKRDELKEYLKARGVQTGIYYPRPLHLQECFGYLGYRQGDFSEAEEAARTSLALPIFPELKKVEKEYVAKTIREFFG